MLSSCTLYVTLHRISVTFGHDTRRTRFHGETKETRSNTDERVRTVPDAKRAKNARLASGNARLRLVFICRENPGRSGISLFPDRPRFCRLMKTRNRGHPRLSGMVGDKLGKKEAFLFSRRVPDFCDGRRSFKIYENFEFYCRGRRR